MALAANARRFANLQQMRQMSPNTRVGINSNRPSISKISDLTSTKPMHSSFLQSLHEQEAPASQPLSVPLNGHSLTQGSYEIGGTQNHDFGWGGSLSGTTGGKLQTLGGMPHHAGGQMLGLDAHYGGASRGGSLMSGGVGISATETPGGRKTKGMEAQASLASAAQ